MANIDQDLQAIMEARYGRDVRKSIHDAIYDINVVADEAHTVAVDSQESAYNSAQAAAGSANDADISATNADNKAVLSESWAHGGTGTRSGEDTNNAEYWAHRAEGAVSGVASFNGRSGAVVPTQDDYTIGQIKATGTQGQVPTLNSQGKLEMQTPSGGSGGHTIINSSGNEMTQRSKLKFANATVTDDGVNDATIITTMSGGMVAKFDITSDAGSTVTVTTPSGDVITAEQKTGSTTEWIANTTEYGTHTLTATLNGQTATTTVVVDACKVYMVAVAQFNATITVTYPTGATCTCVGGGESYTATTNPQVFTVHSANTYTITVTDGTTTKTESVVITTDGQSESLTITLAPDGSTVTPTDDIQTWLNCANIWDKSYTTLSEVLADTDTLVALMVNDNACDYLVRSTTWVTDIVADSGAMLAIGASDYCADTLLADSTWCSAICNSTYYESVLSTKQPSMTSNTTPSGVASASSNYPSNLSGGYQPFNAFDWGTHVAGGHDIWASNTNDVADAWLKYDFERQIKIYKFMYQAWYGNQYIADQYKIQGSNDGSTWTDIYSGTTMDTSIATDDSPSEMAKIIEYHNISSVGEYRYYRFYVVNGRGNYDHVSATRLYYYGRENSGVQTWLHEAGITDKDYTTLAEVLADSTTLSALMASQDAVDYMVGCTEWADTICADQTAMSYIGLNNYCANTLLADSTWCNAIANSAYIESVMNVKVPTMTSNTTPSGTVTSSAGASYVANTYKAFAGGPTNIGQDKNTDYSSYLQYAFDSAKKIIGAIIVFSGISRNGTFSFSADNNSVYSGSFTSADANTKKVCLFSSVNDATAYKLTMSNTHQGSDGYRYTQFNTLQYYGREDV